MLHHRQYTPPAVRSLLDHLGAASDACDALIEAQGSTVDTHDLLRLELTAVAHVLQAREDMKDLPFVDGPVASQISLFLTVTGCLEEAAPQHTVGLEAATTRLIGGRIAATTLAALTRAMRDVIELCLVTSSDVEDDQPWRSSTVSEALIWATGPDCA
jgi:hypothetical protein